MDSRAHYHTILENLIMEYASHKPSYGEIESEVIIDAEKGHYEILQIGWQGESRVHSAMLHFDLIGDKVWIQYDGTSPGVADELVEAGIPRDAIVLGFRPAHVRPHTGYAVN